MSDEPKSGPYQLFMAGLSVYVLTALFAQTVFAFEASTLEILDITDAGICLVFFIDFIVCFVRAENRARYMATWGWIDLLSSLPAIDLFRWGRAARVFRILRVLRGARATRYLSRIVLERRSESALWGTALVAILLVVFGSIAILQLERHGGGPIHTASDAVWWSIVSITTVGYGDMYPVTPSGRVLAVALMLTGIGLFGTFTAYIASTFVDDDEDELRQEVRALRDEIRALGLQRAQPRDTPEASDRVR